MAANQDLGGKLDALIRLTALQVMGDRTGKEAIVLLGRAGLDNDLIAEIVGTTPATVRSSLSRTRRERARVREKPETGARAEAE